MRLIGTVKNEKQAFIFYSYLLGEGIHSTYEARKNEVLIWVYEEDQIERAAAILEEFKANPLDPKFAKAEFPTAPPQAPDLIAEAKEHPGKQQEPPSNKGWRARMILNPRKIRTYPLTYFIIMLCVFLYFWIGAEQAQLDKRGGDLALKIGFTPLQQILMFDYPASNQKVDELLKEYPLASYKTFEEVPKEIQAQLTEAQNIPTWKGIMTRFVYWIKKTPPPPNTDGPKFTKIKEGEWWRLFTPALLHGGLLHILFNMAWVWILLRQIEERLPKWKILILILVIAIIPNVAQYWVSGPYFLGFSGVVVGLVGFIWVRQKIAPWEGYPLQRTTIIFVLIYVASLLALELFTVTKMVLSGEFVSANIANTAHIVGGLIGALLAFIPLFSRGVK